MDTIHVVTCFLERDSKIMLFKRSQQVGSYQERWAGISGYIDPGNTPLGQARQEIEEELGLAEHDYTLLREGLPLEVVDQDLDRTWVVHPFRFLLKEVDRIRIDWEHTEYRWVSPAEISSMITVPQLEAAWERVR
jgi:8-oxo-dGTP pyrophosphatase MutT (NUDIX family)